MELLHQELTQQILAAAFAVHSELGHGFLERVYQKAMQVELIQRGLTAELEHSLQVRYRGVVVGDYHADLFVEGKVIVELKVAKQYNPADEAQLLNELKAAGVRVGLLINFGREKVEFKRMIM